MLEKYSLYVMAAGMLLGIAGYVWLIIRAFQQRRWWGVALIIFPPAALIFICGHFRRAIGPVCVLLLAAVVVAAPYAASYYERHFIPLKPYEQVVDGQLRITLTGLKDFDYATLRQRPKVVVLQMANPDVVDQTLENLKGMDNLVELDLNGTQITDSGLAIIADLPQLKTLRIARTKITDEGFHKYLFSKESLVRLDLTGTEVKSKTKRDWKKQKPDEREYVD
jgi:hypothetical protein